MRGRYLGKSIFYYVTLLCISFLLCIPAAAQEAERQSASADTASTQKVDLQSLAALVTQLQEQVKGLNSQVNDLRSQQQSTQSESAELRKELESAKSQLASLSGATPARSTTPPTMVAASPDVPAAPQSSMEDRLSRIEESQQLTDSRVAEQSQTKVESSSKYRVRLSGLVLLNMFANRGSVDNQDFPEIAEPRGLLSSGGTFGGSLRQSQIGLQAFGPDIAGAHTSADIKFDFAGGFPNTPNGFTAGIARLRTGTIRLDWTNTSVIAGQDTLFIAPLTPTSLASIATPALSYSGNLWAWTPQIRVEHRFVLSDSSSLLLQGGILDSLSGDLPQNDYTHPPTWGENSGQPAYAARIAWSHRVFGQNLTAGVGGYWGRQTWGFGRNVDGWANTFDLLLPLGKYLEFSGQFYRGSALGGLGGGIGQSVLWNGLLFDPGTTIHGLDSMGGWAQLKIKPAAKFEINAAFGDDNPFASQLREYNGNTGYYGALLNKNLSPFINFIYQPRSDVIFSLEYRRLKTFTLDSNPNAANQVNLGIGYIF